MKFATQEEIAEVSARIEKLLERELGDIEQPMVELAVRYYAEMFGGN
jgi:hypothetical protein